MPSRSLALAFSAAALLGSVVQSGNAQDISLNYDTLASLEAPIAAEVGDVTFALTGLLDAPLTLDFAGTDDDVEVGFIGNFQVSAETQLSNRWTVGVAYFGQYETDVGSILDLGPDPDSDDYTDNIAGFVGSAWGTALGGNVTGIVREETRRERSTGNGALAFDQPYGDLAQSGGAYAGQFGPARLSFVVDEDGHFDVGGSWSRPIGNRDYRFTARYTDSTFDSFDQTTTFDSQALGLVGGYIFGSTNYDLGIGYEHLSSDTVGADRWYVSAGIRHKTGALTLSLEGHYGQVDGEGETSAAFGAMYDIARGLSVNLGVNYAEAYIVRDGVVLIDKDQAEAVLSLRYSF